jgi:hypothetical protein
MKRFILATLTLVTIAAPIGISRADDAHHPPGSSTAAPAQPQAPTQPAPGGSPPTTGQWQAAQPHGGMMMNCPMMQGQTGNATNCPMMQGHPGGMMQGMGQPKSKQ